MVGPQKLLCELRSNLKVTAKLIDVPLKLSQVVTFNSAAEQQLCIIHEDGRLEVKSVNMPDPPPSQTGSQLFATHHGHHFAEELLSLGFECIVPLLRILNRDLLLARSQAIISFFNKLIKGHTDAPSIFNIRLVLLVM